MKSKLEEVQPPKSNQNLGALEILANLLVTCASADLCKGPAVIPINPGSDGDKRPHAFTPHITAAVNKLQIQLLKVSTATISSSWKARKTELHHILDRPVVSYLGTNRGSAAAQLQIHFSPSWPPLM